MDNAMDNMEAAVEARLERASRFDNVGCSSCGESFGPGDNGFSHCENHAGLAPKEDD